MQIVALVTCLSSLRETHVAAQRIRKAGHEALNLSLIEEARHVTPRTPREWRHSQANLLVVCDALIVLGSLSMSPFPELEFAALEHNIPVFYSFEEWYITLSD